MEAAEEQDITGAAAPPPTPTPTGERGDDAGAPAAFPNRQQGAHTASPFLEGTGGETQTELPPAYAEAADRRGVTRQAWRPGPSRGQHPEFGLRAHDSHTIGPFVGTVPPPLVAFPNMPPIVFREPVLRGANPLLVLSRGGVVGIADKVEWRLFAQPPNPVAKGMRIALCDALGAYRGVSRTVGDVVGADRNWITFLLSPGPSAPTTVQTITVPVENAVIPRAGRVLRRLLRKYLTDEHPFIFLPLPDRDTPNLVASTEHHVPT